MTSTFKPRAIFNDMPLMIKQNILEHLDPIERFPLRKCCKTLQKIVDTSPVYYKKLAISESHNTILLIITLKDGRRFETKYSQLIRGCERKITVPNVQTEIQKVIPDSHHIKIALGDFEILMKNSKAVFGELSFWDLSEREFRTNLLLPRISQILYRKNVCVEKLLFKLEVNEDDILAVLTHLKPEVLHEIDICQVVAGTTFNWVVRTKQWKKARAVSLRFTSNLPVDSFLHFVFFTAYLEHLSLNDVKKIMEAALSHGDQFKVVAISVTRSRSQRLAVDEIENYIKELPENPDKPNCRKILVPDANYHLDVCYSRSGTFIVQNSSYVR